MSIREDLCRDGDWPEDDPFDPRVYNPQDPIGWIYADWAKADAEREAKRAADRDAA
jgi:hypothetical protein